MPTDHTDECNRGTSLVGLFVSQQNACRNPEHRSSWVVLTRKGNYSAFSGYRWTPSDYSSVKCTAGGATWRTKAKYVDALPDTRER